jgi:hypothetical protein
MSVPPAAFVVDPSHVFWGNMFLGEGSLKYFATWFAVSLCFFGIIFLGQNCQTKTDSLVANEYLNTNALDLVLTFGVTEIGFDVSGV